MPQTPDRTPGPADEEELILEDRTTDGPPTIDGAIRYYNNDLVGKIPTGVYSLTQQGGGVGGISDSQHRTLRHLIHFIDEGPGDGFGTPCTKAVTGGLFPTSIVWKDSSSNNIIEKIITRSGTGTNLKPTPIKYKVYDGTGNASGNVLFTITDTVTYLGISESSRSRSIATGDA